MRNSLYSLALADVLAFVICFVVRHLKFQSGVGVGLRLLIADDHEVLRVGVRALLAHRRGWHVVGEATTGTEAIDKVEELSPDVVILDLSMPGMNGFEVAEKIRRCSPSTKIVFFSVHEIPASARIVGGDAFVAKSADAHELISAIELVAAGHPHRNQNRSVNN